MHKVFFILLILFTCGNGQSNQNKLIINYQNQESLNINQKTSYVLIQLINKDCKLFFYDELSKIDGDTIRLKVTNFKIGEKKSFFKKKVETIRLLGIDSPEIKQPYGIESSNYLYKLIKTKNIHVIAKKRDKYKRLLGKVFLREQDVNLIMVETGHAH